MEGPASRVRLSEGRACHVRLSEGPACQVRELPFDNPFHCVGHDKRAPPTVVSEGPACQVRELPFDNPFRFGGHDKRAPPSGRDKHAPPSGCNDHAPPFAGGLSPMNPTKLRGPCPSRQLDRANKKAHHHGGLLGSCCWSTEKRGTPNQTADRVPPMRFTIRSWPIRREHGIHGWPNCPICPSSSFIICLNLVKLLEIDKLRSAERHWCDAACHHSW